LKQFFAFLIIVFLIVPPINALAGNDVLKTTNSSYAFQHAPARPPGSLALSPSPLLSLSLGGPSYDEQIGLSFCQNFAALAYDVVAVAQTDSSGYGPAYLLNGVTNMGYWYQVDLQYCWPTSTLGIWYPASGFQFGYEVFNPSGNSILEGNVGFSGSVNKGDTVLLNLYFTATGQVEMLASDQNTGAHAFETYSAEGATYFAGTPTNNANAQGFFTGLMTEWYHNNPYYGDEQPVTYSDSSFGLSSAWMWMDEYEPSNLNWSGNCSDETLVTYSANPTQLQYYFTYNGANEFSGANDFVTGSIGTQQTSITLLPAGGSTPLSSSNEFAVSYTLGGQPQVSYVQDNTVTLFADTGTNLAISGVSTGSLSTGSLAYGNLTIDEWVLNSQSNSLNITSGSTTTFYYYELLNQQVGYFCSEQAPSSPTLTYYTAPSVASSQSNPTDTVMLLPYYWQQTIMVLRGTALSISNNISGTAQDQWSTPISSWTITQPNELYYDISYYHQYEFTISYTSSDGSVPTAAPLLSGTQFGSPYQLPLATSLQTTWLDENTPWSISNVVTSPSGTEQWVATGITSGSVSGATTITPVYYDQYQVTASYSTSDNTSPSAVVFLSGTSLGSSSTATLTTLPQTFMLDAGSSWSVNNQIIAGSGTEQWVATGITSGSVSGATTITPVYYDKYQVTFVISPSGAGSTSPAGINVWENAGSLSLMATPSAGYSFSIWSSNTGSISFSNANSASATATISGTGTITATFALTPTSTPSPTSAPTSAPPSTPSPTATPTSTAIPYSTPNSALITQSTPSPTPSVSEFPSAVITITALIAVIAAILFYTKKPKNVQKLRFNDP
jgi:hypothetical protein